MRERIDALTDAMREDLVRFVRDIVAIPSPGCGEEAVIARIRKEMEALGYDVVWTDAMGNLFGRIGTGRRIIAIDGHSDTVDAGNRENWKVDPFEGVLQDGVIYGRGAVDQKGGLASAVYAGKLVKDLGLPKDFSLIVVASVLEEDFEGLCWQHILQTADWRPEVVLLTEPSNLEIKIGQRGRLEMDVHIRGVSSHGSAPERGDNAITKSAPMIEEVTELHRRLKSDSMLGKGGIVATDIRSSAPSLCAVPDACTLHLDRRMTECETRESCCDEIRALKSFQQSKARLTVPEYEAKSYTGLVQSVQADYPAWLMDEDHPVVRTAVQIFKHQFGKKPDIGVWQFSTNGVATQGLYDIPTIGFGPGDEAFAHTPEDQVRIEDLSAALRFYASFVLGFGVLSAAKPQLI